MQVEGKRAVVTGGGAGIGRAIAVELEVNVVGVWLGCSVFGRRFVGQQIVVQGMDPEEIGRRTLDGIEAGEFLIPTHSHSRRYAETRRKEIAGAFDRQASYREEDERYDVSRVIQNILEERSVG